MKSNMFKKVFALVLALSMVSIPSLSFAGFTATGTTLFDLDFTKDYGSGEATDASYTDNGYTLEQINAGTYVENGEVKTVTNPTITPYNSNGGSIAFGKVGNASWSAQLNATDDWADGGGRIYTTETAEASKSAGMRVALGQTIETGKFVLEFKLHGHGSAGRHPVMLDGVSVLNANGSALQFNTANATVTSATNTLGSARWYRLTLQRNTTDQDWTVNATSGTYTSCTGTGDISGTISKSKLPSFSNVDATRWFPEEGKDTALSFFKMKAVYYPVEKISATLPEISEIRTVSPSFDVSFNGAVDEDTLSNVTFAAAGGANMIKSYTVSDNTATFELVDLTDGTAYTLTVPETVTDLGGVGVNAATKTITASSAKNVFYSFDASTLAEKTYASTDTDNLMAVGTLDISNRGDIIVSGGLATFKGSAASSTLRTTFMLGETVTKGHIQFDFKFDNAACNGGWFYLRDSSGANKEIFSEQRDLSRHLVIGTNSLLNGQTFTNEKAYLEQSGGKATIDARLVIGRNSEEDDWNVKVYELDVSRTSPVFEGTIAKTALDGITGSSKSVWVQSNSMNGDVLKIRKWSAELVQTSEISVSPIESAIVKNSAGTTITTLADVLADGEVDCVVNVNQTGGTVFVAIYNSGWKLLQVKSIPVTQVGEQAPIEFTGVTAAADSHMKLFYWNDDFQPLTGFINPLARQ